MWERPAVAVVGSTDAAWMEKRKNVNLGSSFGILLHARWAKKHNFMQSKLRSSRAVAHDAQLAFVFLKAGYVFTGVCPVLG
jgi:hypothetical protein